MQNIGKRIKEMRKAADLTQERLAEYLNVSYQAVSKWETGINAPDLALIAPLCRVLGVTSDELLGLTGVDREALRLRLEQAHEEMRRRGSVLEVIEAARELVTEFPGEGKYLVWLGNAEAYASHHVSLPYDEEAFRRYEESAVLHIEMALEAGLEDFHLREQALATIAGCLSRLGRQAEGLEYARQMPESGMKDLYVGLCLEGEEKIVHEQNKNMARFNDFWNGINHLDRLLHLSSSQWQAAIEIAHRFVPDGNFQYLHMLVSSHYVSLARCLCREGQLDRAMEALTAAVGHWDAYFRYVDAGSQTHFTVSWLNRLDHGVVAFHGDREKRFLRDICFDPLREREEFRALENT